MTAVPTRHPVGDDAALADENRLLAALHPPRRQQRQHDAEPAEHELSSGALGRRSVGDVARDGETGSSHPLVGGRGGAMAAARCSASATASAR